jgi:hypothetical protein
MLLRIRPIPAKRFDISEPKATEAGIGDDNRPAADRHHFMESLKEAAMGAGVVVAAQGINFFVQRDGAPTDGYGGFEDERFAAELTIAPIDDDDGALSAGKEHRAERGVDPLALIVKVRISEQAVDGFDVMFDESIAASCPAEMGQCELSAVEQCLDNPKECDLPRAVADNGIAFEPGIQQANGVHAALSHTGGGVAKTIRSDGGVPVDPLILCF